MLEVRFTIYLFYILVSIRGIMLTDDISLYGSHPVVLITKQTTLIQSNTTQRNATKQQNKTTKHNTAIQRNKTQQNTTHLHYSQIIKTNKFTNMYCIILKHTLKHLKSSYMFRSMIIIREHM
jgi:hypothetical protein